MERVDILVLFLTWSKCFSIISIQIMLTVRFLFIDFIMLRCHLYPTHSFQDLYNEWILDFVQGLFSIQWGDYMASIFLCNYIYWFTYEPSLQLWKEANLITVDDFFDVFLNLVSKYLLRIFMSMLINFFYIGIECCELSFYNCLVGFFYFSQFWEF